MFFNSGEEFQRAVEDFTQLHSDIPVEIKHGNHEELYRMLKAEEVDIVLNDQRRAFSDEYVNKEFITTNISIVLAKKMLVNELVRCTGRFGREDKVAIPFGWICGFANAQGGKIYIGIKDNGEIVGIKNYKKLLEDIPNQARDILGVLVDVNLLSKNDKKYLEIVVPANTIPVSYKGEYHYRSGSTKQVLKGSSLTQFLFKKMGMTWDAVTVDNVSADVMKDAAFDIFKTQSLKRNRMTAQDLEVSKTELLDKLNLLDDQGKLTRAAVLLFHHNPEKYVLGSFVKIGYFEGSEILYQDEIHGSLMEQAEKTLDLIFTKYLKATISYDGATRVEKFPISYEAAREAVYNSLVHKSYGEFVPIQIRIYYDRMEIYNDAVIPEGWTTETFLGAHKSKPHNTLIAGAFYKAGYIESWGRGIKKMCDACIEEGNPTPEYVLGINEIEVILRSHAGTGKDGLIHEIDPSNVPVNVPVNVPERDPSNAPSNDPSNDPSNPVTEKQMMILKLIENNPRISTIELGERLQISKSTIKDQLNSLKSKNKIKRIGGTRGYWEVIK